MISWGFRQKYWSENIRIALALTSIIALPTVGNLRYDTADKFRLNLRPLHPSKAETSW